MDENAILDKVLLLMSSAETDEKLENLIYRFLLPVILKLDSQQDGVRKKVMEVLVHANKRVRTRPTVQLPMDQLMECFLKKTNSSFITNFVFIYIKMGFPRLKAEKQVELLPQLIWSLENVPEQQQTSILALITPSLQHVEVNQDKLKDERCRFRVHEDSVAVSVLLDYCLNLLLLPYGLPPPSPHTPKTIPPGFSEWSCNRVVGESGWTAENLEASKVAVSKFLLSGLFDEKKIMIHGAIAMADTRFAVSNIASSYMSKMMSSNEWKDESLVRKIYSICLGSVPEQNPVLELDLGQPQCTERGMKADRIRQPVCRRVKMKLLPALRKGVEKAIIMPDIIFLIYDCVFGLGTTSSLRTSGLLLLQDLLWYADEKVNLEPVAPAILKLVMFMTGYWRHEGEGTIKEFYNFTPDTQQRLQALTILSHLGKKASDVIIRNIDCLQMLLSALETESDPDYAQSLRGTINGLAPCFINADFTTKRLLEFVLSQSVNSPNIQVRRVTVELAKTVYPATHVESRFLLLLSCGDREETVSKDAVDALFGPLKSAIATDDHSMETNQSYLVPSYEKLVNYVVEHKLLREKGGKGVLVRDRVLGFNDKTFHHIVRYLQLCLISECGLGPFESNFENPHRVSASIRPYLLTMLRSSPLAIMNHLRLLMEAVELFPSLQFLTSIMILVGSVPENLSKVVAPLLPNLKTLLESNQEDVRLIASEIVSVIIVEGTEEPVAERFISSILSDMNRKTVEGKQGSVFVLGFVFGRKALKELEISRYSGAIDAIVELMFSEEHALLTSGGCYAVGQLARSRALRKTQKTDTEIVERLLELSTHIKHSAKMHDRAITALGYLCLDEHFKETRKVIQGLLNIMREVKDIDLHFAIGDALVCCSLGPLSPETQDPWTFDASKYQAISDGREDMKFIFEELLKETGNLHPNIRQASCVSLLAIVSKCRQTTIVQDSVGKVQNAFAASLAEGNDFVQDVASKGLGLLHDISPPEKQQELVDELMSLFVSGSKKKIQVTGDTKIFQEGSLGSVPGGGQISTYRELCSLASDLNQPDLVYKFMNLANNSMLWNSKKGAAFGFASIAPRIGKQMDSVYPILVPKLYRYRFDPTAKVQLAMSSIWSTVVKDDTKTVDAYLKPIFEDLSSNLTSNQWRVRESACYALAELFRGRTFEAVLDEMPDLFRDVMKVMDDIKESVRKAAEAAAKSVIKMLLQMTNADGGKTAPQRTAEIMFPVVLEGLQSPVKEVHALCLDTAISMVRSLGHLVSSYLATIIPALINSVEAAHHQQLNYLSVRLSDQAATQEMFDSARISAAKMTVPYETAQHTLQFLDTAKTEAVVSCLLSTIKSNNPLPVKGCCACLISSLAQLRPNELQPLAGKILAVLCKGLGDKSVALRTAYAVTIGQVVRVAKESSVERLLDLMQTWYLEADDLNTRSACMQTVHAISRYNPEVLRRHSSKALALAFLGMNGKPENDTIVKGWERIWEDMAPGTEGGIRFYLDDILSTLKLAIACPSYPLRSQAARSIGKIARTMKLKLDQKVYLDLVGILQANLGGRIWIGKEEMLTALADVVENLRLEENDPLGTELTDLALRETKKGDLVYKIPALAACGRVFESLQPSKFDEIMELIEPIIKPERKKEEDEDDDDVKDLSTKIDFQVVAMETVGRAWPRDIGSQTKYAERVIGLLNVAIHDTHWKVQLASMQSLEAAVKCCLVPLSPETIESLLKAPMYFLGHASQTSLKLSSMRAMETVLSTIKSQNLTLSEVQLSSLQELIEEQMRSTSADVRLKCDSLLKLLRS